MIYSDPVGKSGIVEKVDALSGSSSDSYPIEEKTRDINLGLDRVFSIIFRAGGKWKFDDSNHEDYPTITADLVQGQRDYTFTEDEQGNLILEIEKVFIKTQASGGGQGVFQEIFPADPTSERGTETFYDGLDVQATPWRYQKQGNGLILGTLPGYSQEDSIKMYISREGSYFSVDDTTKMPGFAGLYHSYLAIFAALEYAKANTLTVAASLAVDKANMEDEIQKFYGNRARDERSVMRPRITRFK